MVNGKFNFVLNMGYLNWWVTKKTLIMIFDGGITNFFVKIMWQRLGSSEFFTNVPLAPPTSTIPWSIFYVQVVLGPNCKIKHRLTFPRRPWAKEMDFFTQYKNDLGKTKGCCRFCQQKGSDDVLGALRSAFIFNLGQLLRRSPPLVRPWEANLVIVVRVFVLQDLNAQD